MVGEKIWLEYFDQNTKFEEAFTPQYCTVVREYAGNSGGDDWYLVALSHSFEYESSTYDHLVVSSRWSGYRVGGTDPTAVFIMLVPEPDRLENPLELDRSLYIAWGFSARNKDDIKR